MTTTHLTLGLLGAGILGVSACASPATEQATPVAMSDARVAALNAAKSKNFEALVAANGGLVESCEQCHKAFKPELPSEGIVHPHTH
jgi:hypothetical protein